MTAVKRKARRAEPPAMRDIDIIYQENILDHYRRPRNFGRLTDATFSRKEANFSCGDDVEIFIKLDRADKVSEVRFEGHGCAISQAASSLLTGRVIGLSRAELAELTAADMIKILGIPIGASRMRCATLGLKALQNGLAEQRPKR